MTGFPPSSILFCYLLLQSKLSPNTVTKTTVLHFQCFRDRNVVRAQREQLLCAPWCLRPQLRWLRWLQAGMAGAAGVTSKMASSLTGLCRGWDSCHLGGLTCGLFGLMTTTQREFLHGDSGLHYWCPREDRAASLQSWTWTSLALVLLFTTGQDVTDLLILQGRGRGPHLSTGYSQRICGHVLKPLCVLKFPVSK